MSYVKLPENKPIENMQDAFSVKGFNVVVTGGNRGIGIGIAKAFAQSGANVVILCRNTASGEAAVAQLQQYGGKYACFGVDISDIESVKAAEKEVFAFFDHVDVLVNNAGVATNKYFLDDTDMQEWHKVINTNVNGVANMVYAFAPHMRDWGHGGSIINISSIGGQHIGDARSHPNGAYFTSKAALDMFTKYLAIELGDMGIRVNCIAPGPTHSDLDADLPASALQEIESDMPMHRFGEGIEIGAYCVFLASHAGCHITGSVCNHDGGMVVSM